MAKAFIPFFKQILKSYILKKCSSFALLFNHRLLIFFSLIIKSGLSLVATDLIMYDAVLGLIGKTYQDVFLNQNNRPKGMEYFDFVVGEIHGLHLKKLMDTKKECHKVMVL